MESTKPSEVRQGQTALDLCYHKETARAERRGQTEL